MNTIKTRNIRLVRNLVLYIGRNYYFLLNQNSYTDMDTLNTLDTLDIFTLEPIPENAETIIVVESMTSRNGNVVDKKYIFDMSTLFTYWMNDQTTNPYTRTPFPKHVIDSLNSYKKRQEIKVYTKSTSDSRKEYFVVDMFKDTIFDVIRRTSGPKDIETFCEYNVYLKYADGNTESLYERDLEDLWDYPEVSVNVGYFYTNKDKMRAVCKLLKYCARRDMDEGFFYALHGHIKTISTYVYLPKAIVKRDSRTIRTALQEYDYTPKEIYDALVVLFLQSSEFINSVVEDFTECSVWDEVLELDAKERFQYYKDILLLVKGNMYFTEYLLGSLEAREESGLINVVCKSIVLLLGKDTPIHIIEGVLPCEYRTRSYVNIARSFLLGIAFSTTSVNQEDILFVTSMIDLIPTTP